MTPKDKIRVEHVKKVAAFFGGFTKKNKHTYLGTFRVWSDFERWTHKHTLKAMNTASELSERLATKEATRFVEEWAECFNDSEKFKKAFKLNFDARGYALKFFTDYEEMQKSGVYVDWGSNGIFAPDDDSFYWKLKYKTTEED